MNNYINYDWYRNNKVFPNMDLFNPSEGYFKGNLFRNLYSQYKNYQPIKLVAKNEQERMLYELSAICFAAHELNLYLDLHPDDQSMLALFNDYRTRGNNLTKAYESKFGPLFITSDSLENSFDWEKKAWPWEGNNV